MVMGPGTAFWYVVYCRPAKETQVARLLETNLGLPVYLPEAIHRHGGQIARVPFFPRYLFVQTDLAIPGLERLRATPGVVQVLTLAGRPQPVPAALVAAIRAQVERLNAAGGLPAHPFHPGDPVRLTGGPLAGLEGLFVGPAPPAVRVRILLDFLGRPNEVEVDAAALERNGAAPVAGPGRRTRGRGRPIHSLSRAV